MNKHKCEGCKYKSEHQEMMFRPMGVCLREHNLIEAEKTYNAEVCPFKQNNAKHKTGTKCDDCNAPKAIKDSWGCNADMLFNAWEILKCEFLKRLKIKYEPEFQCRFADLIKSIEEDN